MTDPVYTIGPFEFLVQVNFHPGGTKLDFVNDRYQVAGKKQILTDVIDKPELRRGALGLDTRAYKDGGPTLLEDPVIATLKNKVLKPTKAAPGALNEFTYLNYTIVFEFDWFDRKPVMESVGGFDVDQFNRADTFINSTLDPAGAFKVQQVIKYAPGSGSPYCEAFEGGINDEWLGGPNFWTRAWSPLLGCPPGYSFAQLKDPGYSNPVQVFVTEAAIGDVDGSPHEQFQFENILDDAAMALCGFGSRMGYDPFRVYYGSDPPPIGLAGPTCYKRGYSFGEVPISTTERKLNAYDVLGQNGYRITPPGALDDGSIKGGTPFIEGRNRVAVTVRQDEIAMAVNGSGATVNAGSATLQIPRVPTGGKAPNKYFALDQHPRFELSGAATWRCIWLYRKAKTDKQLQAMSVVQALPLAKDPNWLKKGTGL